MDSKTHKPFDDNHCMFRAVAYHLHDFKEKSVELFKKFIGVTKQSENNFAGVDTNQIQYLEKIIEKNIQLYSVFYGENELHGELTRRSESKFSKTINLIQYNNHICWTSDIKKLLKKFHCINCNQFFNREFNLERHMETCSDLIKHNFPNGPYLLKLNVFEKLENVDVKINDTIR